MSEHRPVKVMGICTGGWPFAARIPIAFSKAGFRLAMVSPAGSPIKQVRSIHRHFTFRTWAPRASIKSAINTWSPDLLICFDDQSVRELHRIHLNCQFDNNRNRQRLAKLIEFSLGHPSNFATLRSNSAAINLAKSMDIRCPETIVLHSWEELKQQLSSITYPILLKADDSEGGRGVRCVRSEAAISKAIGELLLPMYWPRWIMRATSGLLFPFLYKWSSRWRKNISLQQCIVGYPANRAVACWNGKVIAGISVKVVKTVNEFGPASVVRIIDNAEMAAVAEQLVKRLHLSGFVGFDFIIDQEINAWFLEINPRATPVAHLDGEHGNLPAAIGAQLGAGRVQFEKTLANFKIEAGTTIALFPQGLARSQSSKSINGHYKDIPWEEPEFVRRCLETMYAQCGHKGANLLIKAILAKDVSAFGD